VRGKSSLAQALERFRGVRSRKQVLSESKIFGWAVAHFRRTGSWPTAASGAVFDAGGEDWKAINEGLANGFRGLPGGSSIAKLLNARRVIRPRRHWRPPLTVPQILEWAEAYFKTYGDWPFPRSEPVAGAPGETWVNIDNSLREGFRGLAGGTSLRRLLAAEKGLRLGRYGRPSLTVNQVLRWADAYFKRLGDWPWPDSGPIAGAPGETWKEIDIALQSGSRGLPKKSSILRLLKEHRGIYPGQKRRPNRIAEAKRLSLRQIRAWAKEHRRRNGIWPHASAGSIPGRPDLNWQIIDVDLRKGCRGLPAGSSLARLFGRKPQVRKQVARSRRRNSRRGAP
jgi:hypothetical protein